MKRLRIGAAIVVLVSLVPLTLAALAMWIASRNGCTLHEGFANPCIVFGRDIGEALYTMAVMGWLALVTLPLGALAALVWIVGEVVYLVRQRRAGGGD